MATTRQPGLKGSPRSRSGDNLDSGAPRTAGRTRSERERAGHEKRPIMHRIERRSKSAATRDHDEETARTEREAPRHSDQAVHDMSRLAAGCAKFTPWTRWGTTAAVGPEFHVGAILRRS